VLITPSLISDELIEFVVPVNAHDASIALRMPRGQREIAVGSFNVELPVYERPWNDYGSSWNKNRKHRRYKSISTLRGRWHRAFLATPQVQAELSLHAARNARLNRMLRVASYRQDRNLIVRIRFAMSREDSRHERRMQILKNAFVG
jgi:hypothetical protein